MMQQILSFIPLFVTFFWFLLLLLDNKKNISKKLLTVFFGLCSILYFSHFAFFNHQYELYKILDNIWVFISLSVYPIYYYYIRLLTQDSEIKWKWLWLISPALIVSITSLVIYSLMNNDEVNMFVKGILFDEGLTKPYPKLIKIQTLRNLIFKIIFSIELILTVFFSLKLLIEYNKKVNEFYSNTGGKDLTQFKWVMFGLLITAIVSLISNIIGKSYFITNPLLLFIPSLTHSTVLYFIGYVGYRQNFTVADLERDIQEHTTKNDVTQNETCLITNKNNNEKHIKQLLNLFEEKQIFKNPDLRITDVALLMGSNRTYMSNMLNMNMNTSFNELVNSYRVEYAVKLLRSTESENMPMADIAIEAGFPSLSTFYRIFKNKTGISPGEYRTQVAK
ncbi:MAG: helix-turn-helix transcriptional regulator [Dysgonamonadaceae bacterium]|nr:helix-turn-helix transcriptional regulator [Dysgonamonadaceae bacterium]MDD3308860.1 helix-turn-helix transcriptional regulator [Dysgonamonadaceae bacterium]MDD3900422.1 helix-turn-helix transcriptional regulator [Dysgonamonadaceae bacterium]